jgi:hypothetical protein
VLLEQLQPFERAVFLLREVFEYDFAEIATMLDKSEAACRRSFSRAKLHLQAHRPCFPVSPQIHRQLLSGYFQAVQGGDMTPLMDLLSENVTLWADAGGKFLLSEHMQARYTEHHWRSSMRDISGICSSPSISLMWQKRSAESAWQCDILSGRPCNYPDK